MEGDLARVQDALAATEEARAVAEKAKRKAEAEATRLDVDISPTRDWGGQGRGILSPLRSRQRQGTMEEDYQKALEVIFSYGYGCCVFKHNICGDPPEVPNGMPDSSDPLPPKFFVSHRCPPVQATIEDTTVEEHPSEVAKEPEENASTRDQS